MENKINCWYQPYTLIFKRPAGTSRGTLHTKKTYFLYLDNGRDTYIGEANLFEGLSYDDVSNYENHLSKACQQLEQGVFNWYEWREFPSIQFGAEQIILQQKNAPFINFKSNFNKGSYGIPINGLIWMGSPDFMKEQIQEKLNQGFHCIKLKIGVNWEEEKEILENLRKSFPPENLELRVDANGGFKFDEAKEILKFLKALKIHSIEQPIKAGNVLEMNELCKLNECPIALDEELIGVTSLENKKKLLQNIKPQYIILKPALVGGFTGCMEWINLAESNGIGWWLTSALESNIGLNAIAQFTATLNTKMPQGLGTGGLYVNNIESDLQIKGEKLFKNVTA